MMNKFEEEFQTKADGVNDKLISDEKAMSITLPAFVLPTINLE